MRCNGIESNDEDDCIVATMTLRVATTTKWASKSLPRWRWCVCVCSCVQATRNHERVSVPLHPVKPDNNAMRNEFSCIYLFGAVYTSICVWFIASIFHSFTFTSDFSTFFFATFIPLFLPQECYTLREQCAYDCTSVSTRHTFYARHRLCVSCMCRDCQLLRSLVAASSSFHSVHAISFHFSEWKTIDGVRVCVSVRQNRQ